MTGKTITRGEILKVPDAAEYLRCSKITVYRHAEKGDLPGHHFGGQWRFFMDEINRWLREKREAERKFKRRRRHQILAPIKLDKDLA
jgi:excisionase family DNA binding protein